MLGDPFTQTEQRSTKIFALADGHPIQATTISKLDHIVREPVRTVNMVQKLDNQSLLIRGKFAEVGYVSVFDEDEVNIYNGWNATITMS